MEEYQEIERSIIKKYRKTIWSKFVKAVKDYQLIEENDKIMVCISGGKDSFLLAKCMEELHRHSDVPFEVKYVVMNPGYAPRNIEMIKKNIQRLNLDVEIFNSDIFEVVQRSDGKSPCYLCARMRRGCLYNKAVELGCNKIALGHHFDDVIETTLLSIFYGSEIKTMMPKLKSTNFKGLELIRPLYLVKEQDILAWKKFNNLEFLNCACMFTENCAIDETQSKRLEMKKLINEFRKVNPNIDHNIFMSTTNVNLDCILGYNKDGKEYSFLDDYDKEK